jgi:hypothetical protein
MHILACLDLHAGRPRQPLRTSFLMAAGPIAWWWSHIRAVRVPGPIYLTSMICTLFCLCVAIYGRGHGHETWNRLLKLLILSITSMIRFVVFVFQFVMSSCSVQVFCVPWWWVGEEEHVERDSIDLVASSTTVDLDKPCVTCVVLVLCYHLHLCWFLGFALDLLAPRFLDAATALDSSAHP